MTALSNPLVIRDPAIPKGSWVLVTGINGYIGSHVGDQLLGAGYKVRGVVRSMKRANWLLDVFEPYGKQNFSFVEIPDLTADGALDDAVKGKFLWILLD
jgi:nucleoside-diphosphate-sugar epimerase